jgi:hypothetical protein
MPVAAVPTAAAATSQPSERDHHVFESAQTEPRLLAGDAGGQFPFAQTPTAPKITRKIFNEGPKKALLAAQHLHCLNS